MARSLQIKQEESATTSPLFTAFLLLAFGWLVVSAAVGSSESMAEQPAVEIDPE